jgi:hypothetical protein
MNFQKFKKENLNSKKIFSYFSVFSNSYSKFLFVIFSFIILFWGMCFWYHSLYKSEWGDGEKNQYKNSQDKKIQLKEKELKSVMDENKRRENAYEEPAQITKNIFIPYADEETSFLNGAGNSNDVISNNPKSNSTSTSSKSSAAPVLP